MTLPNLMGKNTVILNFSSNYNTLFHTSKYNKVMEGNLLCLKGKYALSATLLGTPVNVNV